MSLISLRSIALRMINSANVKPRAFHSGVALSASCIPLRPSHAASVGGGLLPPPPPPSPRQAVSRFTQARPDTYQLLADEEECTRLNMQHTMLKSLMGGNYLGNAQSILNRSPGEPKAVLDIGCGTCAWMIDMAREFPHASFTGLDAAPMQRWLLPERVGVKQHDVNVHGLRGYEGSFDMVNARMVAMGINDYLSLIASATSALKSGGMLHFQEWDFVARTTVNDADDTEQQKCRVLQDEENPFTMWVAAFRKGIEMSGGAIGAAEGLVRMVKGRDEFEGVQVKDVRMHVVPDNGVTNTPGALHKDFAAGIMRENVKGFIRATRNFTLKTTISEAACRALEDNAIRYLTWTNEPIHLRLRCVWGYKK